MDERPGALVVVVAGEVDMLTSPQLRMAIDEALAKLADRALVIDLTGVTFFGSPGLQVLAVAAIRVRRAGEEAALRVVATHVALRPIQITGLDSVVRLYDTTDAALADRSG
jgi:anti-sigma B factor antagonist